MKKILFLFTLVLSGVILTPAFAQIVDSITVTTDKTSYEDGDTIFVTGEIRELLSGIPVHLSVIAPNGNLVTLANIDVDSDKKFSYEFVAGGALMKAEGTYTIVVLYGTESRTAETTFTFGESTGTPSDGTKIVVSGTDFMINYKITGGKIVSITPDVDAHSLTIAITASQKGSLVITLPRSLIDARVGDQDDTFFVLVDGVEFDFEETTTSTDRTLTIQFPAGAEEIEIIAKDPHANQISNSILIGTDKSKYDESDTILVIGKVRELLSGYPISLRVIAPNGNLVSTVQVDVNSDMTFSTYLTPTELWKYSGTYTIAVLYGTESRTAETTFTFGDIVEPVPVIDDSSYKVTKIPDWIKNMALWYGQGKISEDEFLNAIKYLIDNKILQVSSSEEQEKLDEIEKINLENEFSPKEREWITSGSFQIDRSQYAIGEKIFLVVGGLDVNEKGQIAVMRPLNNTHYSVYLTIPFDGAVKSAFNYYIEPQISKTRGICSVDDIIGKWVIVFRGTDYPNLNFDITKDVVSGTNIEPVC